MATMVAVRWNRLLLCYLIAVIALTTIPMAGGSSDGKSPESDQEEPEEEDLTRLPRIAQLLLFKMNRSVKPCDDFYQYACGRFIASQINRSKEDENVHDEIVSREQGKLIKILDTYADNQSESLPTAVKTAVNIYRACRDKDKKEVADKFLFDEGHRIIAGVGGWPLMDPGWSGLPEGQTLFTLLGKIDRNYGCLAMLQPEVIVDMKDVKYMALSFTSPTLSYANDVEGAVNLTITEFLSVLYPDKNITEGLKKDIEMTFKLVNALSAEIDAAHQERTESEDLYNAYTLRGLEESYKNIHWKEYLKSLFNTTDEEQLNDMHFIVQHPETMAVVDTFFANCTDDQCKKTLINYLVVCSFTDWFLTMQTTPDDEENEQAQNGVDEAEDKKSGIESRAFRTDEAEGEDDDGDDDEEDEEDIDDNDNESDEEDEEDDDDDKQETKETCMKDLIQMLPIVAGRIYVETDKENFKKKKCAVTKMLNKLICALQTQIKNTSWMDAKMLLQAQVKVASIAKNIGYPQWMMNDTKLNDYYASLSAVVTESTSAAENYLRTLTFIRHAELSKMFRHADRHDFIASPADFNIFYLPYYNSLTFAAMLLNPPLFNRSFPAAVNFGTIGSILGHELGHGLTGQGLEFIANGTLLNWMSNQSEPKYNEMAQCFVDQYNDVFYVINGTKHHINGTNTKNENLADNIGVKAAYDAFKLHSKLKGEDKPIRGMTEYSMDKIFFLAYAQSWCEAVSEIRLKSRLMDEEHSPPDARVNEVLKNMPQFSSAFKCTDGSSMAPKKRCSVWGQRDI